MICYKAEMSIQYSISILTIVSYFGNHLLSLFSRYLKDFLKYVPKEPLIRWLILEILSLKTIKTSLEKSLYNVLGLQLQ